MEITQVIDQLKAQLAETEANAQRLRTAIEALEGSVESSDVQPPRRRAARGRATRQSASNGRTAGKVALTPDVVVGLVTAEGVPAREIRSQVTGSDNQVLKVLKDLESAGKIKRTGQRRATKWHRVTDNARPAARSANRRAAGRKAATTRKARQPKSEPTAA
ncbi:MAG: hypothetical protein WAL22_06475 [Solirubrobacteraceae bacterium]